MGKFLAGLRGVLMAITMVIYMLLYSVTLLFRKHTPEAAFRLRRAWMKIGNPIMGNKIDLKGSPVEEPAIYMSNHRSFSDPLLQAVAFDSFIIAKAEVANIPIMHQAAKLTGIIYVKRESHASRKATLIELVNTIKDGYNVLIYPEGTTGDLLTTKPFKMGAFKSAVMNNFAVVPVAIEYKKLKDHWQNRSLISHFFKQYAKWRTPVKISIGPPLKGDDPESLMQKTKVWIDAELLRMQENWQEKQSTIDSAQ